MASKEDRSSNQSKGNDHGHIYLPEKKSISDSDSEVEVMDKEEGLPSQTKVEISSMRMAGEEWLLSFWGTILRMREGGN